MKTVTIIHRDICGNFCDLAGKTGDYRLAWIYAGILDIFVPIALFIIGIVFGLTGMILSAIIPELGPILTGIGALFFVLLVIGAVIILTFLEFREIGLFVILPIGATGFIIVLGVIPILNFIGYFLSFVPWNLFAVFIHWLIYRSSDIKPTTK